MQTHTETKNKTIFKKKEGVNDKGRLRMRRNTWVDNVTLELGSQFIIICFITSTSIVNSIWYVSNNIINMKKYRFFKK